MKKEQLTLLSGTIGCAGLLAFGLFGCLCCGGFGRITERGDASRTDSVATVGNPPKAQPAIPQRAVEPVEQPPQPQPAAVIHYDYEKGMGGGTIKALCSGHLSEPGLMALLDKQAKTIEAERVRKGDRWIVPVVVFVYTDMERLTDGSKWVARLFAQPGKPLVKEVNRQLLATYGKPAETRLGLSEDQRRAIFREYVWIEDWFMSRNPNGTRAEMEPTKEALAEKHKLTLSQLDDIAIWERYEKQWPLPDDAPAGWSPPQPKNQPTAKEAPKKESKKDPNAIAERDSAAMLRVAKAFIRAKNNDSARTQLKLVIQKYPGTMAAAEADDLLKSLK
jgi:hypothetical protein